MPASRFTVFSRAWLTLILVGCGASSGAPAAETAAAESEDVEPASDADPVASEDSANPAVEGSAEAGELQATFRSSAHYNLHQAGMTGAQGAGHESRVELSRAGESWVLLDAGSDSEYSSRPGHGSRRTNRQWRHRWVHAGAFAADGAEMVFAVESSSCSQELEETGRATVASTCPVAQGSITVRCSPEEGLVGDGGAAALRCDVPRGSADVAATSSPWVFRMGSCVARSGGAPMSGPMSFEECAAEAAGGSPP